MVLCPDLPLSPAQQPGWLDDRSPGAERAGTPGLSWLAPWVGLAGWRAGLPAGPLAGLAGSPGLIRLATLGGAGRLPGCPG